MSNHLLELVDVAKEYESRGDAGRQHMRALDGVNFVVNEQETVGVVGESGCGKTTLAKIVMGVITPTEGRVLLDGEDLSEGSRKRARERRRHVQMVFQNPYSSIDPRFTILKCVAEPLQTHTDLRGEALEMRVRELLDWVGMPGDLLTRYSHELSGGQLQRVAVARALVLEPRLVVLDEPTSALDVSVQAQILNLLNELRASRNLAYLFISHDLSVIRHVCDWVVVMYLGRVVEMNTTDAIFSEETKHPYTEVLLSSMPSLGNLGRPYRRPESKALGQAHHGKGCSYAPRCPLTIERCWTEVPQLNSKGTGHPVACHVLNDGEE